MQIPLQISFRNMDPSPAVEARIREKAAKLERFHDRIIGCTVVVEAPHRSQNQGKGGKDKQASKHAGIP